MTDLTLDEYRGIFEEELGEKLKQEVKKYFGSDSPENDLGERKINPLILLNHNRNFHSC